MSRRTAARESVMHFALAKAIEEHPIRLPGADDDAQAEYLDERLMLACRDYALAVDDLDPDEKPAGWVPLHILVTPPKEG